MKSGAKALRRKIICFAHAIQVANRLGKDHLTSVLFFSLQATAIFYSFMMGEDELHPVHGSTLNESSLYFAVQNNDQETVQRLLTAAIVDQNQLDHKDSTRGWTALFVACFGGSTSIAKLLLDAGAQQDAVDLAGWTAKEHAVFRGHLSLADLFVPHIRVPSGRLEPMKVSRAFYERKGMRTQIFIYLGPSHTRTNP